VGTMAEPASGRQPVTGSSLARVGALAVSRPRPVLAVWLVAVAVLSLLGLGLEQRLSTRAVYIDGTPTKREHEIAVREFGSENAVIVMLRGPAREVEAQGKELEARFEEIPRSTVLSPWTPGASITGLSPRPQVAAFVVNVRGEPDEGLLEILPTVRERIDETVAGRVHASVAGAPAIVDSIQKATHHATEVGQWIAIPALLLILLVVFRSVLAAALPVVVGGAVVAASRGVFELLSGFVHLDPLSLGAMGMMGLALGVDYSLLVVSRYREETSRGVGPEAAMGATVAATGRTVLIAGTGLSLAMLVASQVLPGAVVTSVALAVITSSVLSVASAIVVTPAMLALLGPRLDRWSLPRRSAAGWSSRWSRRLSADPRRVALPIVLFLSLAGLWAFSLDSGVAAVALLPEGDSGRRQQEEVQRELGPGWVAPMEVLMNDPEGPVTTAPRLEALVAFQRRLERDPGVETMTGVTRLAEASRRLRRAGDGLAAQQRALGRLGGTIARTEEGASRAGENLDRATAGAVQLSGAVGASREGAGALADGLGAASGGSRELVAGLGRASSGSSDVAAGAARASTGADGLADGLAQAEQQNGSVEHTVSELESAMRSGERRLRTEVKTPIAKAEAKLEAARASLQQMSAGRADPQYTATLEAVEAASAWLSGVDPGSGEPSAETEGADTGVTRAEGQFDLGMYLSRRLGKTGHKASQGIARLRKGSDRLEAALARLSEGSDRLAAGMRRLSDGGAALPPGLVRLAGGAQRLADGLGQVQAGAEGLTTGLSEGARRSRVLSQSIGRLRAGADELQGAEGSQTGLEQTAPKLFHSGYTFLASLEDSPPARRRQASFLVSLNHGGSAMRMLVVPRHEPSDSRAADTRDRIEDDAARLARETGTEVLVGGVTPIQLDVDSSLRGQAPLARLALALVTVLILLFVIRALVPAIISGLLNVLTVAATFGLLALLFDGSLLGGPGFVDGAVIPATIMLVFGLAIDYEVFVFARIREEYLRSGDSEAAVSGGIVHTAPVVTGAATIMIVVFVSFAVSSYATMRNFGAAQAIGVAIDAFLIRLVVVPAMMRALGKWAWWVPSWLDRLLPGRPNPPYRAGEEGGR
jgi:RND superfamily putative drug exporter